MVSCFMTHIPRMRTVTIVRLIVIAAKILSRRTIVINVAGMTTAGITASITLPPRHLHFRVSSPLEASQVVFSPASALLAFSPLVSTQLAPSLRAFSPLVSYQPSSSLTILVSSPQEAPAPPPAQPYSRSPPIQILTLQTPLVQAFLAAPQCQPSAPAQAVCRIHSLTLASSTHKHTHADVIQRAPIAIHISRLQDRHRDHHKLWA